MSLLVCVCGGGSSQVKRMRAQGGRKIVLRQKGRMKVQRKVKNKRGGKKEVERCTLAYVF